MVDVYGLNPLVVSHHKRILCKWLCQLSPCESIPPGDGSLDFDLAQGSNQCVLVSVGRCQQAPNRNTRLGAL